MQLPNSGESRLKQFLVAVMSKSLKRSVNFLAGHERVRNIIVAILVTTRYLGPANNALKKHWLNDLNLNNYIDEDFKCDFFRDGIFPRAGPRWFMQQLCASTTMCYVLIRYFFPIDRLLEYLNFQQPANCYLVGRFIIDCPGLAVHIGALVAIYHFSWRLLQMSKQRKFPSLFIFLYQNPIELKRIQRHLISGCSEEVKVNRKTSILLYTMTCKRATRLSSKLNEKSILRQIRPNRTIESYNEISFRLAIGTLFFGGVSAFVLTIIMALVLYEATREQSYLDAYPTCSRDSSNFRWHKLYAVVMDNIISLFIWLESAISLTSIGQLPYLLSYDLSIYLTHLELKIATLDSELKLAYYLSLSQDQTTTSRAIIMTNPKLGGQIFDLQDEIRDFYEQFEVADSYASDIFSFGIFIWISCFVLLRYAELSLNVVASPGIRFCQALGLIGFTLTCASIWHVHRRLCKMYAKISSILAHSHPSHKRQFVKILGFFLDRTGFTLLGGHPFTSRTYVSLLGWTISCLFIVESLFRKTIA